jgi:hypothetical protein
MQYSSTLLLEQELLFIVLWHVWLWHLVLRQLVELLLWHLQSAVPVLLQ